MRIEAQNGFSGCWGLPFLLYGRYIFFAPFDWGLCAMQIGIYGRNDTMAMGRFLDIIIDISRA